MADIITPYERKEGGVTAGAVYSIAYFYDKDNRPCNKEDDFRVNIVEYDKNDKFINETYAFIIK